MKKKIIAMLLSVVMAVSLTACGSGSGVGKEKDTNISSELTYDHSMELTYAEEFSVDYYNDGYALATVADDGRYLIVPEGKEAPDDLAKDIIVLKQPLTNIYLVASAVMDMFVSIDALDSIRFSSQKEDGWYIEAAKQEMEAGNIIYAGKYSAPDYEQILSENCELAIENTMISHTPEVKEQLEKFGVPVLTDHSSYEKNPLGRTEWVKLYGLLTGHEKEAEEAFAAENEAFASIGEEEETGKTVAFFYITTNGEVNVRKSADYLPKMIELAGGKYIFDKLGDEDDVASTMSMQMEEFYAGAKDADYIIYKHGGLDKFVFDKDGAPIGLEDVLKPMREASPHLFKAAGGAGGYKPAGGGNPPASNPFAKETFNLTEQGRLFKQNPEQARQMAAAAGVKL